jgi:hypothetical protein
MKKGQGASQLKPIRPVNASTVNGATGDGTAPLPNPSSPYGQPVTGQPAPGSQANS